MAKKEPPKFPLLSYIDELVEGLRGDVPKAMKHWDADAIHDSRVATRRLKAALDLLKPVLSDEHLKPFAKVLKKLRRRLGPMRDLDVMIDHLHELKSRPHADAVAWLLDRLTSERESARKESTAVGAPARVLSRLGTWWGLREEVEEACEATDSLLAESLHQQLDSFAEQADRLTAAPAAGSDPSSRQDPHAVRIAGKSFRYTLEMAAVQGHKLPSGIMKSFKRMQESLGMWHDYVVLTERAMQTSLQDLLPHHNADLAARVLELSKLLLKRATHHMDQFSRLWLQTGGDVARAVRLTFPLTKSLVPDSAVEPPSADVSESPAEAKSSPITTS
ncbi:MAG TPA: CHAD domain-containing protein [Tepidisphaeraceae bacterium]|jgi:CHAD domain-containing protein|nr:CHAD domain-containing protein [Tepidisphaeraceae bacterium]